MHARTACTELDVTHMRTPAPSSCHHAQPCAQASLAAVEAILDAGASIHAPCKSGSLGQSALHVAAVTCRPEVVELLLKRGESAEARFFLSKPSCSALQRLCGGHQAVHGTMCHMQGCAAMLALEPDR